MVERRPEAPRTGDDTGKEAEPSDEEIRSGIEALLFVTGEPVSEARLAALLGASRARVREALGTLAESCEAPDRGIFPIEVAGGWQLATKERHRELIEALVRDIRRVRLSSAALETLAIIAYRQPVTRSEIEEIRGVNVDGVMKTLLEKRLIRIVGKKEEPGRPLLYGTTDEFLLHFGLKSLKDLPPLSEFEEIAAARAALEGDEEKVQDWHEITEPRRRSLEALQQAAERELGDLDGRLQRLKPPRVVTFEETAEAGKGEPTGGAERKGGAEDSGSGEEESSRGDGAVEAAE
ncbi:MAG: SMC-Scp complex subunit ScpB [Candidatus Hydrogenedentota bacterium]|nr:MAG: SMC-Scp complex subunit ScpB [Candidatus Hydrogenedentota bacterium]